MSDGTVAFLCGMFAGAVLLVALLATCGRTPTEIEQRWCAEMFAAPQADTLAILKEHDFCAFPRPKP